MEDEVEKRGPGRPRQETSDIRSTLRVSPVRDEKIRERKRKGGQIADKFHIDAAQIPDGMSYEWKRATVYGASDPSYDVLLREQGWEPVPAERHADLVATGASGAITRDGLILMERPVELTREAQAEDRASAIEPVTTMKHKLGEGPAGTLPRQAPNLQNYIRTSYEAMPIDG